MASPQTRRTLAVVATLALVASLGVAAAPGAAGALPDDNGRIAFLREGDIWTMNADGTDQRVVVDAAPEGTLRLMSGPAWSPDGKKLAFSAYVAADVDARADVWVIGGDGTGLVNLTKDSSVSDWSPSWSPDGAQIGWVSGRTSFARGDIWVMDADGANRRNVTRDDALQETPTWSDRKSVV